MKALPHPRIELPLSTAIGLCRPRADRTTARQGSITLRNTNPHNDPLRSIVPPHPVLYPEVKACCHLSNLEESLRQYESPEARVGLVRNELRKYTEMRIRLQHSGAEERPFYPFSDCPRLRVLLMEPVNYSCETSSLRALFLEFYSEAPLLGLVVWIFPFSWCAPQSTSVVLREVFQLRARERKLGGRKIILVCEQVNE